MSNKEPKAGIFWIYENRLFHIASEPVSKAIKTSISADFSMGHYALWFILKDQNCLNDLPPAMREEYDSISRDRVVYLFEKEQFVIYHGNEFNNTLRKQIIQKLNLPAESTVDEMDEHYNPLPDEYLF